MPKYKVEIEAVNKTRQGLKEAERDFKQAQQKMSKPTAEYRGAGGKLAVSSKPGIPAKPLAGGGSLSRDLSKFTRMVNRQTIKPLIKKGITDPFQKSVTKPFETKVIRPFSNKITKPITAAISNSFNKGLVQPFQRHITKPFEKNIFSPFKSKFIDPMQKKFFTPFKRMVVEPARQRRSESREARKDKVGGGIRGMAGKLAGIGFGVGAALAIPASMVAKLGQKYKAELDARTSSMIKYGGGKMTKSAGLVSGKEISRMKGGFAETFRGTEIAGTKSNEAKAARRSISALGMAPEETGRILGSIAQREGGGKNAFKGFERIMKIGKGIGLKNVQLKEFISTVGSTLEDSIAQGFTASSQDVAQSYASIQKLGGGMMAPSRAKNVFQAFDQSIQSAATLQGGAGTAFKMEVAKRMLIANKQEVTLLNLMEQLEKGAKDPSFLPKAFETARDVYKGSTESQILQLQKSFPGIKVSEFKKFLSGKESILPPSAPGEGQLPEASELLKTERRREINRERLAAGPAGAFAYDAVVRVEAKLTKMADSMTSSMLKMVKYMGDLKTVGTSAFDTMNVTKWTDFFSGKGDKDSAQWKAWNVIKTQSKGKK